MIVDGIGINATRQKQRNRILKIIFNAYNLYCNFILNLLLLYKNKDLTYSKLYCLLTNKDNKLIITVDT